MADHRCMDFRVRGNREGDDVLTEWCTRCGKVRHETDGVRPMAWFHDPTNPTGHRYAYSPSHNDPDKPTVWKHIDYASSALVDCGYVCRYVAPYGFVPEAGCPVHDVDVAAPHGSST